MRLARLAPPLALTLMLAACFGGGKVPSSLLTLGATAPAPADLTRTATAAQTVTIDVPVVPKALKTVRVPAVSGGTTIAYVKDLQWIDLPERLFQQLLSETVKRTTNRLVLDPAQSSLDPGLRVTGELDSFGYDANSGMVVVRYDAAIAGPRGDRVETRRFEAREAASGDAATVGPALNRAANHVAIDVAQWIGSRG